MRSRLLIAAAATVLLAGCGSSRPADPPAPTTTLNESGVVESPTLGYRVGASTELTGAHGLRTRVSLNAARSAVGTSTATPPGRRLFAVRIKVTNTGTTPASIDWGSDVLDNTHPHGGPTHSVADVATIDAGPLLPYPLRLAPRATATGWIAYLVPTNTLAVAVDFGIADTTAGLSHWAMTSQR